MKLTYYGHACFGVESADFHWLFDPFIRQNPLAKQIKPETVAADAVLLSHGHQDHIDDAEEILQRTGALLIGGYEVVRWFEGKGIEQSRGMNPGGSYRVPLAGRSKEATGHAGTVKMVSAIHSSSLPDGTYGGVAGGFLVETAEGCFYYSGDTALTMDMKAIGDQHDLRFAVLPIGDNFTMNATDAALAAVYCGARRVVGVHYDTFPAIEINREEARKAFDTLDVELLLPAIGETIEL